MEKPIFCATACRDFSAVPGTLVFFGDGCLNYRPNIDLGHLGHVVLDDPLKSLAAIREAQRKVHDYYEEILILIVAALNTLHEERRSNKYWRIVLGPWLYLYLTSLFDRWCWAISALDRYPNGTTIGLSEECFYTPRDTIDLAYLLNGDIYNLQLYTKIFRFLRLSFSDIKCMTFGIEQSDVQDNRHNWKRSFKQVAYQLIDKFAQRSNAPVQVKQTYFSYFDEKQLFLRSLGSISVVSRRSYRFPDVPVDEIMRSRLAQLLPTTGDFAGVALKLLPEEIPQCFIEGYENLGGHIAANFPQTPNAIFSINSYFFDEPFKRWAARCSESGTMIIGGQHGNFFGSLAWLPQEEHEISICDRYYTWGWDKPGLDSSIIVPFVSTKLVNIRETRRANMNTLRNILMTVTSVPRFAYVFMGRPSHMIKYLKWQKIFVTNLTEQVLGRFSVRLHHVDHGWKIGERLRDVCPQVIIEQGSSIPFLKRLTQCCLFVCDHLGTTLLEAFAAGKPCLFFFDPETVALREEANPYYSALRDVGVLFHDPIEAANAVNLIVDDPESWWMDPARQVAVQRFTHRFARASKDAVKLWTRELISVIKDKH